MSEISWKCCCGAVEFQGEKAEPIEHKGVLHSVTGCTSLHVVVDSYATKSSFPERQYDVCWCDAKFQVPRCCGRYLEDPLGNLVHTTTICYEKLPGFHVRILPNSHVVLQSVKHETEFLDLSDGEPHVARINPLAQPIEPPITDK